MFQATIEARREMIAAMFRSSEVLSVLITAGADPNKANSAGHTALY